MLSGALPPSSAPPLPEDIPAVSARVPVILRLWGSFERWDRGTSEYQELALGLTLAIGFDALFSPPAPSPASDCFGRYGFGAVSDPDGSEPPTIRLLREARARVLGGCGW